MSYKALYRTYRPASFEDVVGQKHIVVTLQNAVKQNKIGHAYLFCGPRGTGKTTIAKLLAKAVNCEDKEHAPCGQCKSCLSIQEGNHPDIVEIDAASNNGVDEIRDLIEKVKYSPIEGRYKVYIIDEVHMLSSGAFNALLKTLEEPPSHVIFILATTEPHKVLPTIISRCQRYDFTKVETSEMIRRIHQVLIEENIECEEEAIRLIATLADGGMRDALSILDQCIAYAGNKITCDHVNDIYGITTISDKLKMLHHIAEGDAKEVLNQIKIWNDKGIDIRRLTADMIEIMKEAVIYSYTKDTELLQKLTEEEAQKILKEIENKKLLDLIQVLMETTEKYRSASNVSSYFEVAVLKLILLIQPNSTTEINESSKVKADKNEKVKEIFHVESPVKQEIIKPMENQSITQENIGSQTNEKDNSNSLNIEEVVEDKADGVELNVKEVSAVKNEVPQGITIEEILGLMVQANKSEKMNDLEKWKEIDYKLTDLTCARYASLLRGSPVVVSGENFILIATDYPALANEILELKDEIENFIVKEIEIDKVLFVTTIENFKQATNEFIERRREGTLPNPLLIEKKIVVEEEVVKEEDKPILEMKSLFGDDFEIVDEEEKQ